MPLKQRATASRALAAYLRNRPDHARAEVVDDLAGVEGVDVAGRLGTAAHDDLGRGLIAVDLADVAVPAPVRVPGAPVAALVEAPGRTPEGTVAVVVEGVRRRVEARVAVGGAGHGGEPVVAVLDRQLGRAQPKRHLDLVARGDGVAREADGVAVGLEALLGVAAALAVDAGRLIRRGRRTGTQGEDARQGDQRRGFAKLDHGSFSLSVH